MNFVLREARESDLPEITAIYAHHVRTGLASFEIEPPDETEMRVRFDSARAKGFPYLACECEGQVAGFAYASLYRARPAYRFTLEDSVYVHPDFARRESGAHSSRDSSSGARRSAAGNWWPSSATATTPLPSACIRR